MRARLAYLGMSQEDLAHKAGVSHSYVNKLLSGQREGSSGTWVNLLEHLDLELKVVLKDG